MIKGMAKKRSPGKHGGVRARAGRPPLEGIGTTKIAVSLLVTHIAKIERWQDEHGVDSFSGAVRDMIDAASPH